MDHAKVAAGLGCWGWSVGATDALAPVLTEAFAHDGPVLVDVTVDPEAYSAQYEALRG